MNRLAGALGAFLLCFLIGGVLGYTSGADAPGTAALVGASGGALLAVLLIAGADAIRRLSGSSVLLVGGLLLVFLGERMLADGTGRMAASGLGLFIVFGSMVLRLVVMSRSTDRLRRAHLIAIAGTATVLAGLGLYGLTLDTVAIPMTDTDEALGRWRGSLGSLFPILVLTGTLVVGAVDRIISLHPRRIPPRVASEAALQALSGGLAIALIFPVNYLASQHEWEKDVAYFRVTSAGTSTLGLVGGLTEPIEITLFYPAGSDVQREIEPYFRSLQDASGGMVTVQTVDQALVPVLAEELKVRDNGMVILKSGEATDKIALKDDLSKSKRKLKKLDESVQKSLLKVARGQRRGYFVVGHGEANFRERDNPVRKLNSFKKLLESQNIKLTNLGAAEGLANRVPDDADLLILAAPEKELLPAEVESINAFVNAGGKLFVMADPGNDPMAGILGPLGITAGTVPLAHATSHLKQTRGPNDNILLVTNRYGSHKAVKTLSKAGTTNPLMVPTVVSITKADDAPGRTNVLVRSFPETWEDTQKNRIRDADEVAKVWDLAVASEGPEVDDKPGWRVVVIGDVNWASDTMMQYSQANQIFAVDAVRWMMGEESLIGETNNEEDVKIQHTRDDDWAWFYLTVIGLPLMIFGLGIVIIRIRRSS